MAAMAARLSCLHYKIGIESVIWKLSSSNSSNLTYMRMLRIQERRVSGASLHTRQQRVTSVIHCSAYGPAKHAV